MSDLLRLLLVGTFALTLTVRAGTQSVPSDTAVQSVELDVVVLGADERPLRHLEQRDFQIKEDGRPVTLTGFREVSVAGISGRDDSRSVVLLLDDNSVPLMATTIMQNIAKLFLSFARPSDTISVIRLTHREDEAAGGLPSALERIDEYRTGSLSYFGRDMRDDALQTVARVSKELEPNEHQRKVLVCIGAREVCDPYLLQPEDSLLWGSWREALVATARANASVYAVSPAGVGGRLDLGGGFADNTGGGVFVRSNDLERQARLIWDEASHYYLVRYTPSHQHRNIHKISVSVRPPHGVVRARHARGD
jgi:VWFA-related protein